MTRFANLLGAILFLSTCFAAAVLAGGGTEAAANEEAPQRQLCCVYMIF